jgi:D-alanyl-D-alanine carboxypeptidase/D-alanyl-D-alanine-endopeptidase (penicillin-binding protein 4)
MMPKLNRDSDNFFAEHVFKAAAAKALGQGTYEKAGEASATFFVRTAHAPNGQMYQADGSGLSALNRTSARAVVAAMVYAHRQPWSDTFHESLAIAGDRRGSMRSLFVGTPAAGKLHAKTGYIRNVRTLSGYVPTTSGDTVVFSFLYNGRNTSGARGAQTQLGNLLVNYSGR